MTSGKLAPPCASFHRDTTPLSKIWPSWSEFASQRQPSCLLPGPPSCCSCQEGRRGCIPTCTADRAQAGRLASKMAPFAFTTRQCSLAEEREHGCLRDSSRRIGSSTLGLLLGSSTANQTAANAQGCPLLAALADASRHSIKTGDDAAMTHMTSAHPSCWRPRSFH